MKMKMIPNMRGMWLVTLAATLAVATASPVHAQRMGGRFGFGAGHFSGGHGFYTGAGFGPGFRSGFGSGYAAVPLLDPLYADALYDAGYPIASQPPMLIWQNAGQGMPAPAAREAIAAPVPPLMIELQGDRYVRVSGDDRSGAEMIVRETTAGHATEASQSQTAQSASSILVFRDGHREEVSGYTIVDGTLYATSNLYTNGSWNKKIALSALNLADTVAANQSRGITFRLPAAPNEVIVR
jgi:hypothetical protein